MLAFIYTRVSSASQDNNSRGNISLAVQSDLCRNYARNNNYEVTLTKSEVVSAREMSKQRKLNSLVKHIAKLKFPSVLLVSSASRLSRCTLDGIALLERLRKLQCTVVFVQERLEYTSAASRQSMRFLISNSEFESDMISERVRASFAHKKSIGSKLGAAPFGFSAKRSNDGIRSWKENKEEQKILTFIREARTCNKTSSELTELMSVIKGEEVEPIIFTDEDGDVIQVMSEISCANIAELLNDYGVTKRGKAWTGSMVNYILKNHQDEVEPIIPRMRNVQL